MARHKKKETVEPVDLSKDFGSCSVHDCDWCQSTKPQDRIFVIYVKENGKDVPKSLMYRRNRSIVSYPLGTSNGTLITWNIEDMLKLNRYVFDILGGE